MHPRTLFEANLSLIERVIAHLCRRNGLTGADAEDFASTAKLALLDDDFAVLRGYEGRSALSTFLAVVLQRLLSSERNRNLGRWRPSAEAKRMGTAAVLLETLMGRDRRPLREVLPVVAAAHPSLSGEEIAALAGRLPERAHRPRPVALDDLEAEPVAESAAEARVVEGDRQRVAVTAARVLRETLATMPLEERMMVRLRFSAGMNVADVARALRMPQRPLYRRIESVLARLRAALLEAGIDAGAAADLIGTPAADLDLCIADWKSAAPGQSMKEETP
jgi:RNA polymerase sigma factor for flagellar operon FliA